MKEESMLDFIDAHTETLSDLELVQMARAGDRGAYGELYRRYSPMVHGLLLARVAPDLADDLVQEVFLKAMTELARLRKDGHFGGWIAAIARNRAADHYRQKREMQSSEEIATGIAATEEPGTQAEARLVLAVIRSLPEAYRDTLSMRLVEGMTGPEIASRSGLTPESVRVNLHRGMKLLRECLNRRKGRTP
jgi:RNA polymerase sigma-70 factor, ECF subfamily